MEVGSVRDTEPDRFFLSVDFSATDIANAWAAASPTEEHLFFEVFSTPHWLALSKSEQVMKAAQVAALVEKSLAATIQVQDQGNELK